MRLFSDVSSLVADPYLREACRLAEYGRGTTAPNPLVGCVVVRGGEIVGRGFHARAGEPHAEVLALREADSLARGSTVYVTLEPCTHHGRTPPCTDALVEAGTARAVVGMRDPSPEASGGLERLREAGVEVEICDDAAPFEEQNAGWLARVRTGLPLVRVKLALSLDARPALQPGRRAAMTGASGAEVTRRLRRDADAVLVSAATVDIDDPVLTVRDEKETPAARQPLRVVLARERLPRCDARIFGSDAKTLLLAADSVTESALEPYRDRSEVERYPAHEGLKGALRLLAGRGLCELLVEPGPRLFAALWDGELVDELVTVAAGGFAGEDAPGLSMRAPDREGDALVHRMVPIEAGIVGDVAVTVWKQRPYEVP